MINRIKYRILVWLLNDICRRSGCNTCRFKREVTEDVYCDCSEGDIYVQARAAWGLECAGK